MEALISIVIPIYCNEGYLRRCLDSVINQTYKNLEIILVDDGSTDGSGAICEEYAARDGRITVIHQSNMGVSAARNSGLRICQGKYIGFVDGDDWIEKDMFSFLEGLAELNNAEIAACGYYLNDEADPALALECEPELISQEAAIVMSLELTEFCLDASVYNKIYKRDIYRVNGIEFDEDITIGEDMLWLCQFIICSEKIVYSQTPKYHVVTNAESATRKPFNSSKVSLVRAHDKLEEVVGKIYPQIIPIIRKRSALSSYRLLREAGKSISANNFAAVKILQRDLKEKFCYALKGNELSARGKVAAALIMLNIGAYKLFRWLYEVVINVLHGGV